MGRYDMGPRNDILGRIIPADFSNQFQVLMLEIVNFDIATLNTPDEEMPLAGEGDCMDIDI